MDAKNDDGQPHAKNLRSGRVSAAGETYCITKCTAQRRPILASPPAAEAVINTLVYLREKGEFKLLCFVVMPDHYHTGFTLLPGGELSQIMRRVGSFTAKRIRALLDEPGPIWQDDGFHEHRCRHDTELMAYVEYIHHNPVRKGLVTNAEDWAFSSAHPSHRHVLDWDWWV